MPANSHTASFVLGQTNLTNDSAQTTQSGMNAPLGLALDPANNRLFVADSGNNRVLVYNTSAISTGMNASNELGQPSATAFTDSNAAAGQIGMNDPEDVAYDAENNRLFVADNSNNRVLVFNTASIANGMAASNILGQTNFTNTAAATTQKRMSAPDGVTYDPVNDRLFVGEFSNNRVLVFTGTVAMTNGMNASNVLGQANFTSSGGADTQGGMDEVGGLSYDANHNRLFVADNFNSRILVFNVQPGVIADGMNASNVLGEPNFTSSPSGTSQSTLETCVFVNYDAGSGRVFVADEGNNRVMIFEGSAMSSFMPGYE